jgi:LacI family transcriptional regulator
VTILDVAAAAGVSRQTVSRAMNDSHDINAATRQRVLEVSERLGYRASRFARSLVEREKVHALGLMVASFRNPYYTDIAGDMLATAAERGWQLVMASGESGDERAALRTLSNQVDAIVGHFGMGEQQLLEASQGLPVVILEGPSSLPGMHSVELDLERGVIESVEGLRAKGVRRFGMVDFDSSRRHLGAYEPSPRRGYFERAVGDELTGVVAGDGSISGGADAFTELLRAHPDTEAVLVFNDLMAMGAVQAAPGIGLRVPHDVRIMGVDGLSLGEAVTPALSSISIDRQAIAAQALDIVETIAAQDFRRLPSIHSVITPKVVWRQSA